MKGSTQDKRKKRIHGKQNINKPEKEGVNAKICKN
jgi:hypothetical protein